MLSQGEADALIAMPKVLRGKTKLLNISHPAKLKRDVDSTDGSEAFILHVTRNSIRLEKLTSHFRGRKIEHLARICVNGGTHRNHDGTRVGRSHLHVYREGYGDGYAVPLPAQFTTDLTDVQSVLRDFLGFVNITDAAVSDQPSLGLSI